MTGTNVYYLYNLIIISEFYLNIVLNLNN